MTITVLTIAGSDSGGGAGIQADLKAFARCGVHGTCAITAITAQNTLGVTAIHPVPPEIILAQVRAVLADIGADAVKLGMLGTAAGVLAVADALEGLPAGTPVVVDPVMVAESGARLLEPDAESALIERILPRATVLTPNLPEARVLAARAPGAGRSSGETAAKRNARAASAAGEQEEADEEAEARALLRAVLALGPANVVLTGGHRTRAVDLFAAAAAEPKVVPIAGKRHPDGAAHGSGCTHSALIAAQLALGRTPLQAARAARAMTGAAIGGGLRDVGAGAGPVDVLELARIRSA